MPLEGIETTSEAGKLSELIAVFGFFAVRDSILLIQDTFQVKCQNTFGNSLMST